MKPRVLLAGSFARIQITWSVNRPAQTMERLAHSLNRLLKALVKHHPEWPVAKPLIGLSDDDSETVKSIGDVCPTGLVDFLKLYDFKCCQLFPFFDAWCPTEYAAKIAEIIEDFSFAFEDGFVGWTSSTLESCKLDQDWRTTWIPIGWNNADYVFVDMEPADSGVVGQIVEAQMDGKYLSVIASSFTHLLDRVSEIVEDGQLEESDYRYLFPGEISVHVTERL